MSTLTTKAIYQNGVLIPDIHPPYDPLEAVVIFISVDRKIGNAGLLLNILNKNKGILTANIDGVKYEDQVRNIASQDWDAKIKQTGL